MEAPVEAPQPEPAFDMANLEQLTNQAEGFDDPASIDAPATPQGEPPQQEATPAPEGQVALSDEQKAFLKAWEDAEALRETPFKTPKDFVEGYKNLQREFTDVRTKTKPYEAVLERLNQNPQFREWVEKLVPFADNPQLLQSYSGVQAGDPQPNPINYGDLYTPENLQRYNQDLSQWQARQMDSRFGALKSEIETSAKMDNYRREFVGKFPDVKNPDEVLQRVRQQVNMMNPYEAAYKLANWDNVISQTEAKIRKELTSQIQEAGKTKTPQGTTAKAEASANEVIAYIAKYGGSAAEKRYTPAVVQKALQLSTME